MCWAKKALLGDTPAGLFLFQVARSLIDTKILMTQAEQLTAFVVRASYDDLSEAARQQLKIRVLDSVGCGTRGRGGAIVAPRRKEG